MMTSIESILPLDTFTIILDFLEVSDLYSLGLVNKAMNSIVHNETVYEQLARRKFPQSTLYIGHYLGSWKDLLQDDNSKNGVYRKNMMTISKWLLNGDSRYYINAIRCMYWDRWNNDIWIDIEAFGHNDLRSANATSIFRAIPNHPRKEYEQSLNNELPKRRRSIRNRLCSIRDRLSMTASRDRLSMTPSVVQYSITQLPRKQSYYTNGYQDYRHNSTSHNLCRQYYDAEEFVSGAVYMFTYNGSYTFRGSDYPCVTFLDEHNFQGNLKDLFDVSHSDCNFVSRNDIELQPSSLLRWPSISDMPHWVRQAYLAREWGQILPPALGESYIAQEQEKEREED